MTPEQAIGAVLTTVDRLRRSGIRTRRPSPQIAGSIAMDILRGEGYEIFPLGEHHPGCQEFMESWRTRALHAEADRTRLLDGLYQVVADLGNATEMTADERVTAALTHTRAALGIAIDVAVTRRQQTKETTDA